MKLEDLQFAFDSGSGSLGFQAVACIHKRTREIVYDGEEISGVACPVSDIESDDILRVGDLDLGRDFV